MTWLDPIGDLRTLLSDGPTDKLRANQKIFGTQNGTNLLFKTFEFRRVTNFADPDTLPPLGYYLNDVLQTSAVVASDDPITGYTTFTGLTIGPDDLLNATFYVQWFTDAELTTFLVLASNWIGQDDQYGNTPSGLKTALLQYAMGQAYQKLALKYAESLQSTYRLEDKPDPEFLKLVSAYQDAADNYLGMAKDTRDDFYSRKGQSLSPYSRNVIGNIRQPTRS